MHNLVNNAVKFTDEQNGRIVIGVEQTNDMIRVVVEDNGSGIPENARERIFEKFGQVEARREGHKHSTGLGLTFCKMAVEAHGGEIGVESDCGKGSRFWFTLPKQG